MSRVVMVTGAASGIGAGLASHFVSLGDRVIALDMDRGGLTSLADRLASPNLMLALADVTDDAAGEGACRVYLALRPSGGPRQQRRHDRRPAGDDPARNPA